ncbi:hypothetical protein THIARS_60736 [Thiomonas delicata]|uniref:Uncharacterized protein n=1 Tax=Thiomonas delicata TaxID=364030 RepID=A0A238D401_THIDL|nr:hypothetical protein THIARS_60736 [Thiomonas delicata]
MQRPHDRERSLSLKPLFYLDLFQLNPLGTRPDRFL